MILSDVVEFFGTVIDLLSALKKYLFLITFFQNLLLSNDNLFNDKKTHRKYNSALFFSHFRIFRFSGKKGL